MTHHPKHPPGGPYGGPHHEPFTLSEVLGIYIIFLACCFLAVGVWQV